MKNILLGAAFISCGMAIVTSIGMVFQGDYPWYYFFKFFGLVFIVLFISLVSMFGGVYVLAGGLK